MTEIHYFLLLTMPALIGIALLIVWRISDRNAQRPQ